MGRKCNTHEEHPRQVPAALTPGTLPSAIKELFGDYKISLEALNRSPKTISSYFETLNRYFSFLQSKKGLDSIEKIGRNELNEYLLYLHDCYRWPNRPKNRGDTGKLSPFTIQVHVRAIKAFWGWLSRESYIQKNPLEKFRLPSVPKTIIKIITPDIFTKLLALIDRTTPKGTQHYCIMLALYDGGLRISELLESLVENVDFSVGSIRVTGKGNRERDVPLSRLTIREIRRYLRDFRPPICRVDSPYLFPRPDGKPVTVNSIQQFMRRLANKAGIEGLKLHPHLLRHAFGSQFIINGGNVFYLKELMGHSSLSTTLMYSHLLYKDLCREHAKFSPVSNLKLGQQKGHVRTKDTEIINRNMGG